MKTTILLVLIFSISLGAASYSGDICGGELLQSDLALEKRMTTQIRCQMHDCDDPAIRNLYLLNGESPLTNIRLNIVYFGDLSGQNRTTYDAQLEFFQQAYLQQMNITWNITTTVVTDKYQTVVGSVSSQYRVEHEQMAQEFYVPGYMTLLWTTFYPNLDSISGYAFTPQTSNLTDPTQWYAILNLGAIAPKSTVMIHEVGHMLGLLHTFASSYYGSSCTYCNDNVNSENHDIVGDLCSDTRPVSQTSYCDHLISGYDCSSTPYGNISLLPQDNFMSYTNCPTRFTVQQTARARCYLDRLINFVVNNNEPVSSEPLAVPDAPIANTPFENNIPPASSTPSTFGPISDSQSEPSTSNVPSVSSPVQSPSSNVVSTGSRAVKAALLGLVYVIMLV